MGAGADARGEAPTAVCAAVLAQESFDYWDDLKTFNWNCNGGFLQHSKIVEVLVEWNFKPTSHL